MSDSASILEGKMWTETIYDSFFMIDIHNFHTKFDFHQRVKPGMLAEEQMEMRLNFLLEELYETAEAAGFRLMVGQDDEEPSNVTTTFERDPEIEVDQVKFLDGLVDLAYVLFGTAWLTKMPIEEAWIRVHEANMKKVRTGNPEDSKRGSAFDVVKPEGWEPPVLEDLL